jgi:hypothetical protein
MASSVKLREDREWSEGANGQQGSAQGVCGGFIERAWSRCRVHLDGGDLARVAVFLVRRCELSAVRYLVWSGARRWARKRAVFSLPARLDELVRDALVGFGLDGGVQGEGGTMPCRYERCTTRFRPSSAGNVELALGALGSQATVPERGSGAANGWHGRQQTIGRAGRC